MGSSPTRRRSLSRRGLREGGRSSGGTRLRASGPGFYQVAADEAAFRAALARLGRPGRSIRSNRACPVAAIDRRSRPIRGRCQSRHLRQGGSTRALTRARELSCPPPCDRLLVSGTTVHHVACSEVVFYLPQGRSHSLFHQPMHSLDAMHDMHDMYVDGHSHRTATVTGRRHGQLARRTTCRPCHLRPCLTGCLTQYIAWCNMNTLGCVMLLQSGCVMMNFV